MNSAEIQIDLPQFERDALLESIGEGNALTAMEIAAAEQYIAANRQKGQSVDDMLAYDVGRAIMALRANTPRCVDELLEWLDKRFNASGKPLPATPIFSFLQPTPPDLS